MTVAEHQRGVLVPLDIVERVLDAVAEGESVTMIELTAAVEIAKGFRSLAGLAFEMAQAHMAFQEAIDQQNPMVDESLAYDAFVDAVERFTEAIGTWSSPYTATTREE